jgi:hypothetical protein
MHLVNDVPRALLYDTYANTIIILLLSQSYIEYRTVHIEYIEVYCSVLHACMILL